MASPRPKSPRPPSHPPTTPNQKKKDDSFLEFIGTLGRKKKKNEADLRDAFALADELIHKCLALPPEHHVSHLIPPGWIVKLVQCGKLYRKNPPHKYATQLEMIHTSLLLHSEKLLVYTIHNLMAALLRNLFKVQDVQDEGKYAIDSPGSPTVPDLPPQEYVLEENEERSMIEPHSYEDPKLKELMDLLKEWINDELASQRIIVKDLEEDLYDGQVLQKLLEKLTGVKLDAIEVTQNEEGQKQKLKIVLDAVQKTLGLGRWSVQKWSVDSVHSKNLVAILHLLVALARHFRAPIRLPENVVINLVVVQKREGLLQTRTVPEEITATYDDLGLRFERDAFDTLFDHAPDKLQVVKKSLVTFVNKHLNKVNLEVTDLDTQFHDGVYLTLLMGLLEGYFVPLYSFNLTPTTFDHKVHNVSFAFELMQDGGLPKPKARPEDVVNGDLKSTLRVLYNLFTKYKHLS